MILKPIASKLKTKLVIDFFLLMFSLFYSLNIVFYLLEPLFIDFGSIQKLRLGRNLLFEIVFGRSILSLTFTKIVYGAHNDCGLLLFAGCTSTICFLWILTVFTSFFKIL